MASRQIASEIAGASDPQRERRIRFHPNRILIVALVIVVIGAAATLFEIGRASCRERV